MRCLKLSKPVKSPDLS
jgi:hypothetical protein